VLLNQELTNHLHRVAFLYTRFTDQTLTSDAQVAMLGVTLRCG